MLHEIILNSAAKNHPYKRDTSGKSGNEESGATTVATIHQRDIRKRAARFVAIDKRF